MRQAQLDALLDRQHNIPIALCEHAPLGNNASYDAIRNLADIGLTITLRELIHAIGSKTVALPSTQHEDCINAALLYTHVLDLEAPHIRFKDGISSDLQTPRSQEIGIGITCLLAERCFGVPWDQLGALPGPGRRFDYRGQHDGFDGIFESKGTSYLDRQTTQIRNGVEKKETHHARGDRFDVELIISTCIGKQETHPRIMVGDPDFDRLAEIYEQADSRFFRLRHYSRVLQFLCLPKSAYQLNRYALEYLKGTREIRKTILDEKTAIGKLDWEVFGGHTYYGRWYDRILSNSQEQSKKIIRKSIQHNPTEGTGLRVFQGIRSDIYHSAFGSEPFTHALLTEDEIRSSLNKIGRPVSIFPDGTIQVFSVINEGDID